MGVWRSLLRIFGLSNEARVQISAPGIDVILIGEPEKVHSLLNVVRQDLERSPRRRRREAKLAEQSESQIVRPTELDEMDSPYALPEAMVMAVEETTDNGEEPPLKAGLRPSAKAGGDDSERFTRPHVHASRDAESTPISDRTAVAPDPRFGQFSSGEHVSEGDVVAVHDARPASSDFLSDGGPTLLADGSSDIDSEPPPEGVHVFTTSKS